MTSLRRRIRSIVDGDRREAGLSLVELLIAMTIFSLLLAAVVGFFVSANKATQLNSQINNTNNQSTTAMDEMARVIRSATTNPVATAGVAPSAAFSTAGTNSITLYSNVNLTSSVAQTSQVQFLIVGSNLVEKIWQPITTNGYFTFATNPTTTKTIAGPIVLPAAGGPNLFSYLDTTGAVITPQGDGTIATVASIAAVQVNLQVGTANTTAASTLLTNTVGLPNLQIARNPS